MSMEHRRRKLLSAMEAAGLEALFISSGLNRRYVSGFTGSNGFLYLSRNRSLFLTDFRYVEQAGAECPGWEVMDYGKEGLVSCLNEAMKQEGAGKVGFENRDMTVFDYQRFKAELSCSLEPMEDMVERLREVKDAGELAAIRQAAAIGDRAFTHILDYLKPGVSERDIALELEHFMKRQGASGLSFDTIAASGKRSSLPHAQPTDKKLAAGDFLTLDFGCVYGGYCSDMTRTVVIGKASEKQRTVYSTVLKAQTEALGALKAGLTGREVDKVARDIIAAAGYGDCFGHGLGHSLGLAIHENPRVSYNSDALLIEDMMVTIEPGIYIPDFGGVRIEDLVRVTQDGHENFCRSPKELLEL